MHQPEKLFANIFDDKNITSRRLSIFGGDSVVRFTNTDTNGIFKASTQKIVIALTPFHNGLSDIDASLGIQKGKTQTINEITVSFGDFMKDYKNDIARKIGGTKSATFLAFYPHGVKEYSLANKTEMPLLVKRIYTIAATYKTQLGEDLTLQLQEFLGLWQAAIDDQSTGSSNLSDGRADRSNLRHDLEIALLEAIRLVAIKYPDDVAKCMSFFNFNLLTGTSAKTKTVEPVPVTAAL